MNAGTKRLFDTMKAISRQEAENLIERLFYDYYDVVEAFGKKLDGYLEAYTTAHCPFKVGDVVFLNTPVMFSNSPVPVYPKALGKVVNVTCNLSTDPTEIVTSIYRISLLPPVNTVLNFPEKVILGVASEKEILDYMAAVGSGIKEGEPIVGGLREVDPSSRVN